MLADDIRRPLECDSHWREASVLQMAAYGPRSTEDISRCSSGWPEYQVVPTGFAAVLESGCGGRANAVHFAPPRLVLSAATNRRIFPAAARMIIIGPAIEWNPNRERERSR